MEEPASKITAIIVLQFVTLVLSVCCIIANSIHYEFPRVFLPFIFELEAVAIAFIFLVYVIGFFLDNGENSFLLLTAVSAFHGIFFLLISSAMILTFSKETIFEYESDIWSTMEIILMKASGCLGIVTSGVLIAEAILCLMCFLSELKNKD